MQKIYLSVEEISAEMDVQGFAEDHKDLMQEAVLPQFVPHAFMVRRFVREKGRAFSGVSEQFT